MSWVMVDVETDGPCPGKHSMICFGAVMVRGGLSETFYARLRPVSDEWVPGALAVSGFSREETLAFPDPTEGMTAFAKWLKKSKNQPRFISDNNGFDWQFVNWYFWTYLGRNPFGHSSTNLGSLYKGLVKDGSKSFKHLRQTAHTHDPVDDAIGNAEAFAHIVNELGFQTRLE